MVDLVEQLNGHSADPVPGGGPRIPRREKWIDLPDEYAGFRARVWLNFPQRLKAEFQSGEQERQAAALSKIVLEHNGWCDEEGVPFPPAADPAFWDAVPDELAACVLILLDQEMAKLPNSLRAKKGN